MKIPVLFILLLSATFLKAQVTLSPCISNTDFTIVVLGSSTAAGTGPSHPDSTWVNKYRKSLQQINPNNQVINLAVGGYTTYRMMPDSFATPANRPAVNFQHNIDEALSYLPDAIIVNLPSNDRQWPKQEQLSNFDTLFNYSLGHGVPLFICTTQPILPLSFAQYQKDVADSILSKFGTFAIDLFTPLADTNNTVDTTYAADAVHLNDKGHVIIHSQVINADILFNVYSVPSGTDIAVKSIFNTSPNCTDSNATVGVVYANLGDTLLGGNSIELNVNGLVYSLQGFGVLPPCMTDTVYAKLNLSNDTVYELSAYVTLATDSNGLNDTAHQVFSMVQSPKIAALADTNCFGNSVSFTTSLIEGDTLLYYKSLNDTLPISSISPFTLVKDTTLYAQGISGDLTFKNQLGTQELGNINFNGNMFDLVPKKDITLNSIEIKPNSSGSIPVNIYTINNSYKGFEQNASAWVLYKQDTVFANTVQEWTPLKLDLPMLAGDTVGFYIQMANSGESLNYRSVSQTEIHTTSELDFISGVGMGFNFGTIYFPRVITAKFNYAHGFNALGDCHTPRTRLTQSISRETLSVSQNANFTLEGDSLYASLGFTNYVWVNSNTSDTIATTHTAFVDSTQLALNSTAVNIICYAQDKWGCLKSDSTLVNLEGYLSFSENYLESLSIYPNPVSSVLFVENPNNNTLHIELYNSLGIQVFKTTANTTEVQIPVRELQNGTYILRIGNNGKGIHKKVILQN